MRERRNREATRRGGWLGVRPFLLLVVLGLVSLGVPEAVDAEQGPADDAAAAEPAATSDPPPVPGGKLVNSNRVFFVKPGQPHPTAGLTNCGYVYYLDIAYRGPGSYFRIAFRDGIRVTVTPFLLTNMRDSLQSASGYPLNAASGRKLSQISGTGQSCGPATDASVAAAQASVANETFEVWWVPAAIDTDGDGLYDHWETDGVDIGDDGTIDIDLPAMGADPLVPDLFVEVDWMANTLGGTAVPWLVLSLDTMQPSAAAMNKVVDAFAAAPGGPIRLHIDAGPNSVMNPVTGATWGALSRANSIAYRQDIAQEASGDPNWGLIDLFDTIDPQRIDVFHSAIFGDRVGFVRKFVGAEPDDIKGASDGIPGDRFVVGRVDGRPLTLFEESGSFMHELGHNLGLTHEGGPDGTCNKCPEYHSIMNYRYANDPFGGVFDYSRGAPYDDWANLDFRGGTIGAPIDAGAIVESEVPLVDGDGALELIGPVTILKGTGEAELYVDVHNPSAVDATYTVQVSGDLDVPDATQTVTVPAGGKGRATFIVDTDQAVAGTAAVQLTLVSNLVGTVDVLDAQVAVVDPKTVQGDLATARTEVVGADDLDPDVRASLIAQLDVAIGATQATTSTAPAQSTTSSTPAPTTSAAPSASPGEATGEGELARTGTDPRVPVAAGVVALVIGTALTRSSRRRRATS